MHLRLRKIKNLCIIFSSILIVQFAWSACAMEGDRRNTFAGDKVIITKQDDGKEIVIKTGDVIQVELEGQGGAGYIWGFDNLNSEYLETIKEDTRVINKEGFTGGPVLKIWQLRARNKGETDVGLCYYRVWEGKDKAIDTFRIKVIVID